MDVVFALTVELIFAIVFAWSLATWVRRRDPISREVTLVFSALGSLFLLAIVKQVAGAIPEPVSRVFVVLLLLHPVFLLRLVSLIRPLPGRLLAVAYGVFGVTLLPYLALGPALPRPVLLGAAAAFVVTEALAALYLGLTARSRVGAAWLRLALAAIATLAMAVTIVAASAGSAISGAAEASSAASRVLVILAAVAYLVAFLPPKPLRDLWQGTTAYRATRDLLSIEGGGSGQVWTRYAQIAQEATGAGAVAVVSRHDDGHALLGSHGLDEHEEAAVLAVVDKIGSDDLPLDVDVDLTTGSTAGATTGSEGPAVVDQFVRMIPLRRNGDDIRLYLWAPRRAMFAADDRELLSALGAQAATLAEREAIKADQERLSMQLGATVEALQRASQAKSDFLASMSHELRTPLNAILGFSELMRSEPADATGAIPVPGEWIDHIQRGGQHLLALVNDVLDLAKIEAGRLELDPSSFDVLAAVSESVAGLRPLAERKGQVIDVDVASEISLVADRGRFRQILYNLLSNAIKYTPAEGRIAITGRQVGGELRLAVSDTGIGIDPDDQARVFDEFQQVGDRGGHSDGTGLGLALTRRLLEAHSGRIELRSEPGQGSTFTAVFPTASTPEAEIPEPAPAARRATAPVTGSVLIVEDDPSAARLLRAFLEPEGHKVRIAGDGEAALAEARRERPAAILLDVLLPGVDGWEVLRRLKADPELSSVPVVIVTVIDEREVGLALGAADYLIKPVSRSALLAALDRHLGKAKDTRQVRILAVDDDPMALDVIDAALGPAGYDVIRADGGREALEVAHARPPSLVICDLVMPDLDGFDVVASLKADPKTSHVPILVVTAHDLTPADKRRLNGQILGVISKGDGAAAGLRDWLGHALGSPNGADTLPRSA
jgi:signal transduction histidine kinase/CheY-like chemotaxis protein